MTFEQYQNAALRTRNDQNSGQICGQKIGLVEALFGLVGEAGECLDLLKKNMFQGHPLDTEKLAEELGDVQWYLAMASFEIGQQLDEIAMKNIKKLKIRYPNGFNSADSVNRKV